VRIGLKNSGTINPLLIQFHLDIKKMYLNSYGALQDTKETSIEFKSNIT